jgi:hypothetical protein
VSTDLYISNENKTAEKFKEQDYCLGDLNNNMVAAENFMEKYQPIKFLTMMIECLATAMDKKKVQKLQEWTDAKHKELQDHVVNDTGVPYGIKHKKEAANELLQSSASIVGKMKDEVMNEMNLMNGKGKKKKISPDTHFKIPIQ